MTSMLETEEFKTEKRTLLKAFARDVRDGLDLEEKRLSSKYFYDDKGSEIFQEIMSMPEYYLTDCEMDIFENQSLNIIKACGFEGAFNVIELGAGDGVKTRVMLQALLEAGHDPTFIPIDISEKAVNLLAENMHRELPDLKIHSEVGDYFEVMKKVAADHVPALILFLGSNIGNYAPPADRALMDMICSNMSHGDHLLIGADLRKDAQKILAAYDDPHGITKRFNLNLLTRINNELQGDFDLENWDFTCRYDPRNGEIRSYLVSKQEQDVTIGTLERSYHFKEGEKVWTELSKKYLLEELEELGKRSGLKLKQQFMDRNQYFTDTLFEYI